MAFKVIHFSTGDKLGFAGSAILHFFVGAGLMGAFGAPSATPWGYQKKGGATLIEIALGPQGGQDHSQILHQKKVKSRQQDSGDVTVKSERVAKRVRNEAHPESLSQNISTAARLEGGFGMRDGTDSQGPMGSRTGARVSARDRYLYELKILLEGRKIYPQMARQRGESGKVTVRFQVQPDGQIEDVEITEPSQFKRLNQAALALVKGVRQYKPFSESIGTQALTLEVPIEYVLN